MSVNSSTNSWKFTMGGQITCSPILLPGKKNRSLYFLPSVYTRDGQINVVGSWIDLCWRHRRTDSLARNICFSKVVKLIAHLHPSDATVSVYISIISYWRSTVQLRNFARYENILRLSGSLFRRLQFSLKKLSRSEITHCQIICFLLSPCGLHPARVLTLVRKIGGPALCNSLSAVWAAESHDYRLLWGS